MSFYRVPKDIVRYFLQNHVHFYDFPTLMMTAKLFHVFDDKTLETLYYRMYTARIDWEVATLERILERSTIATTPSVYLNTRRVRRRSRFVNDDENEDDDEDEGTSNRRMYHGIAYALYAGTGVSSPYKTMREFLAKCVQAHEPTGETVRKLNNIDTDALSQYLLKITREVQCVYCDARVDRRMYAMHMRKCMSRTVTCPGCEQQSRGSHFFLVERHHTRKCYTIPNRKCNKCTATLFAYDFDVEAFDDHPCGMERYKCEYCKARFSQKASIPEKQAKYDQYARAERDRHMEKCAKYKKQCTSCRKTFANSERHNFEMCGQKGMRRTSENVSTE